MNNSIVIVLFYLLLLFLFLSNKVDAAFQHPPMQLNNIRIDFVKTDTLPQAVAAILKKLQKAALMKNYRVLQREIDRKRSSPFIYSFGPPQSGGAIGFWKAQQKHNESNIFKDLCNIFQIGYTLQDSVYIWPWWVNTPLAELPDAETQKMIKITGREVYQQMLENNGYYTGPRTGISVDGIWMFYLSGD